MSTVRQFAKCGTCGTHGHGENRCPVREYNAELEARPRGGITARMLFPERPELVRLLELVQENWMRGTQKAYLP